MDLLEQAGSDELHLLTLVSQCLPQSRYFEEIDAFLELSCFFHDPADVSNLISGSSAFSKTSLNPSAPPEQRWQPCHSGRSSAFVLAGRKASRGSEPGMRHLLGIFSGTLDVASR